MSGALMICVNFQSFKFIHTSVNWAHKTVSWLQLGIPCMHLSALVLKVLQ